MGGFIQGILCILLSALMIWSWIRHILICVYEDMFDAVTLDLKI